MIGPGMGYKDMITGKFIKGRSKPTGEGPDPTAMF
jgi:hypothetical protein